VATGVNTVMRLLGGAFGVQIGAALLSAHLGAGGVATSAGYSSAFALAAVALVGALGAALFVPKRAGLSPPAERARQPRFEDLPRVELQ
jgi:hypothetical protein